MLWLLCSAPPVSGRVSVVEAVNANPGLGESDRELLVAVYRWLVQQRSARGNRVDQHG
jgi:hypothetical protein